MASASQPILCRFENKGQSARFVGSLGAIRFSLMLPWIAMLSACGEPTTAPWQFGYMTSSFDETPVTTELHTYDLDPGFYSYKIRGIPLKLTFPKKYYINSENLSGGPQNEVILDLDGFSLRPVVDVIRERYGTPDGDKTWAKVNGSGLGPKRIAGPYQDEMTVRISSRNGSTYTEEEYPGGPIVTRWRLSSPRAGYVHEGAEGPIPYENFKKLDGLCTRTNDLNERVNEPVLKEQVLNINVANTYLNRPSIFGSNPYTKLPVNGFRCHKVMSHHSFVFI